MVGVIFRADAALGVLGALGVTLAITSLFLK